MLRVWRISALSGAGHCMDLDIDEEAYAQWAMGFGPVIQEAFPNLTAGEREFLMTGITPAEWDKFMGTES